MRRRRRRRRRRRQKQQQRKQQKHSSRLSSSAAASPACSRKIVHARTVGFAANCMVLPVKIKQQQPKRMHWPCGLNGPRRIYRPWKISGNKGCLRKICSRGVSPGKKWSIGRKRPPIAPKGARANVLTFLIIMGWGMTQTKHLLVILNGPRRLMWRYVREL